VLSLKLNLKEQFKMTLTEATKKYLKKGMTREAALVKVKSLVKKVGQRWTSAKQDLFDSTWGSKSNQLDLPFGNNSEKKKLPKDSDQDKGQGGTIEQKIGFFKSILDTCNFDPTVWTKYGLHAIKEGSEKRPAQFKQALDILTKHGFAQAHRSPMNSDYADLRSKRAVTWYKDEYGNTVNTVSQLSESGKSDFYILNVNPKLSQEDRSRLNDFEAKLNEKVTRSKEKIANGEKIKGNFKTEMWEKSLSDFTKQAKVNNYIKRRPSTPEEYRALWVETIEQALKEGKKIPAIVLAEYNLYTKSTGSMFKMPTSATKYVIAMLDSEQLKKISRNLNKGKDVTVLADLGKKFTLSVNQTVDAFPCGTDLKSALGIKKIWCVRKSRISQ
jgi:hypothetical protein